MVGTWLAWLTRWSSVHLGSQRCLQPFGKYAWEPNSHGILMNCQLLQTCRTKKPKPNRITCWSCCILLYINYIIHKGLWIRHDIIYIFKCVLHQLRGKRKRLQDNRMSRWFLSWKSWSFRLKCRVCQRVYWTHSFNYMFWICTVDLYRLIIESYRIKKWK